MLKKTSLALILIIISGAAAINGQSDSKNTIDVILAAYSAKLFTDKPVPDSEIDQIVKCGIKAPSGRNFQPWKFTVVKDSSLNKSFMPGITPGNIIIIVSGQIKEDGTVDPFDCALATENMYIAAQGLGLGAHIYMTGVSEINSQKREITGIPVGYKAVTILRIGNIDKSVDATSSASTRKNPEEVVIYK